MNLELYFIPSVSKTLKILHRKCKKTYPKKNKENPNIKNFLQIKNNKLYIFYVFSFSKLVKDTILIMI